MSVIAAALEKAGLTIEDMDLVEANEAFAAQSVAVRKDLDLFNRFQDGVANLVNKILGLKKEVRVVPVGFAYGKEKQKDLTAIQIGTPLTIKRNEGTTTITKGDVLKTKESALYNFFEKHQAKEDVPITYQGKPVKQENISGYLKTILCENLEININIANEKLKTPLNLEDVKAV